MIMPAPGNGKRLVQFFALCAFVSVVGCKKQTSQSPSSQPKAEPPAAAANSAPAPANPSATPAAPADSPDALVTARSIDYLKGQIARKNWDQARLALSQLESRSLTPAQRQYVDSLKAQVPQK